MATGAARVGRLGSDRHGQDWFGLAGRGWWLLALWSGVGWWPGMVVRGSRGVGRKTTRRGESEEDT